MPSALVIAAVSFNAVLAVVNAHVMPVSRSYVVAAEVAIVACALLFIAFRGQRVMLPWMTFMLLILGIGTILALGNENFSPKHFRDILIIPVFIMLGMSYCRGRGNLIGFLLVIQSIVLLFMIVEAFNVDLFGGIFKISSYYMNTRYVNIELPSWYEDLDIFFRSERPGGRLILPSLDIHRLSSILMEPVSLGNYCIVATIAILAFWRRMSLSQKSFLGVTTVLILIGSDGRLALTTCSLLVLGSFLFPRLPRYSNATYLPLALIVLPLVIWLFDFQPLGDNFPGRLAGGMERLLSLDLRALFGLRSDLSNEMADSGIAYLVVTQSVVGTAIIWLFVSLGLRQESRAARVFLHGTCAYIALTLLVSYSLFSIKTAAILWFAYGYLQNEAVQYGTRRALRQSGHWGPTTGMK